MTVVARVAIVRDVPAVGVDLADGVARRARDAQHVEAHGLDVPLHRLGQLLDDGTGPHEADAQAHGLVGDGEEQARLARGLVAHEPLARRVAAPALLPDADAEDVASLQRHLGRLAVEGDLVVREGHAGEVARVQGSRWSAPKIRTDGPDGSIGLVVLDGPAIYWTVQRFWTGGLDYLSNWSGWLVSWLGSSVAT